MVKFLIRCFLVVVMLGAIIVPANYIASLYYIKKNVPIISPEKETIVIGNSRAECALNDSILKNCHSLCRSGESYFYLLQKTKAVLRSNKEIKYALIQFSPSEISSVNESIWEDKYIYEFFPKYVSEFSLSELFILSKKNPKALLHCAAGLSILRNIGLCGFGKSNCNSNWGGFWPLNRNMDSVKTDCNKIRLSSFNSRNLDALISIVDLVKKNGVKPIFISSPVLWNNYDNEEFEKIRKTYFADVLLLDFSNIGLPYSDFGDCDHLNNKGATRFSIFINDIFEKELHINADFSAVNANTINCSNFDCSLL